MLKYIHDEKVEFVDLKVIDLPGRWRHRTSRTADAESPNPNPPLATPE